MLHIVNKSPYERPALDACLRYVQPGSAVLLIEDAVCAATSGSEWSGRMREASPAVRFFALTPDLEARGLRERLVEGIEAVDYSGFVDLVASQGAVQSWL